MHHLHVGSWEWIPTVAAGVVGAGITVVAAPAVLSLVGFTSGGIAVGSWAASMMSTAAVANGGAIAAGSMVATLQSVGVAGLGYFGTTVAAAAGAAAGAATGAAAQAVVNSVT